VKLLNTVQVFIHVSVVNTITLFCSLSSGNFTGKGITGLLSMFKPPSLEKESYRVTSLNYSQNGKEVLVSYSLEQIYLFDAEVGLIVCVVFINKIYCT